jgi:hypothetical protein
MTSVNDLCEVKYINKFSVLKIVKGTKSTLVIILPQKVKSYTVENILGNQRNMPQ